MKELGKIFKLFDWNLIAQFAIIQIAVTITFTALMFIIGGTINNSYLIITTGITIAILYFIHKNNYDKKKFITNILLGLFIMLILTSVAIIFYDFSWDGNVYHKETIGLMKNGMNPMKNLDCGDIWVQHYANGTEIFAAVFYSFFNNIEAGKVINFLLSLTLFIYTFDFCKSKKIKKFTSSLIAFALTFNPIMLTQFHTYYIDGVLTATIFLIVLSLIRIIDDGYNYKNVFNYIVLIASIIICVNTKFTAPVLVVILMLFMGLYIIIKNYKNNRKFLFQLILIVISTFIFGIIFVGSSSYVNNTLDHGTPVYPLMGSDAINLNEGNEPASFKNYNHYQKWLYATFSDSYSIYPDNPKLKIPFTISKLGMFSLGYPDMRLGGLGLWFSGILCLSAIAIIIYLPKAFFRKSKWALLLLLLILAIFIPIQFFPVVWQARYYPIVYLIGFIALFTLKIIDSKPSKILFALVLGSLVGNSLIFTPKVWEKYVSSINTNNQLNYIAEKSQYNKVIISKGPDSHFLGAYYNIMDKNIRYETTSEMLTDGEKLYYGFLYKFEE